MDTDLRYKIGIGLIPKIGPVLTRRLVAYCGSVEGIFREKKKGLSRIPGIADRLADYILKNRDLEAADAEIEWIQQQGVDALFYLDDNYPARLKQCEDAPVMLFIRGNTDLNRTRIISIVGTRNPTDYGRSVTQELVQDLAASWPEMLIVSGLAYGIDICAHRSSLRHHLDTAAVLGHGLSHLYPSSHRETAHEITTKGALISEFLHHEKPEAANFVRRNRIIAGMADATVVVESGVQGGALITADIAASYNRDVLAYPGRTNDRYSAGCNRLIKTNKAALMEGLADLEYVMGWIKHGKKQEALQQLLFAELNETETVLVNLLRSNGNMTIDQLALHADMAAGPASSVLLSLEFRGVVKCLPGKVFRLNE